MSCKTIAAYFGSPAYHIIKDPCVRRAILKLVGNGGGGGGGGTPSGPAGGALSGTYPNPGIANNAVTNVRLADMAANTIKGRLSTSGDPQDLTVAQVQTLLGLSTVALSGDYNDLTNLPTIPAQVNLIAGSNVTITGTYPNLTIAASGGGGGSAAWGGITGTLSDQTDLQAALDNKVTKGGDSTSATLSVGTLSNQDVNILRNNGTSIGIRSGFSFVPNKLSVGKNTNSGDNLEVSGYGVFTGGGIMASGASTTTGFVASFRDSSSNVRFQVNNNGSVVVGTTTALGRVTVANNATAEFPIVLTNANQAGTSAIGLANHVGTILGSMGYANNSHSDTWLRGHFYVRSNGSAPFSIVTSSTLRATVSATGDVTVTSLAGTGTRMVVADANGTLSTQAIPSGGSATWGGITGTLTDQTDLNTALSGKVTKGGDADGSKLIVGTTDAQDVDLIRNNIIVASLQSGGLFSSTLAVGAATFSTSALTVSNNHASTPTAYIYNSNNAGTSSIGFSVNSLGHRVSFGYGNPGSSISADGAFIKTEGTRSINFIIGSTVKTTITSTGAQLNETTLLKGNSNSTGDVLQVENSTNRILTIANNRRININGAGVGAGYTYRLTSLTGDKMLSLIGAANSSDNIISFYRYNNPLVGEIGTGGPTSANSALWDNKFVVEAKSGYPLILRYDDSDKIELTTNGDVKVNTLAGTGTRMVVADDNGILSAQAIPSGGTPAWGAITGTLSAQTDLQTALNNKATIGGDVGSSEWSVGTTNNIEVSLKSNNVKRVWIYAGDVRLNQVGGVNGLTVFGSNGNVSIGKSTNTGDKLEVSGASTFDGSSASTGYIARFRNSAGNVALLVENNGNIGMGAAPLGGVPVYISYSNGINLVRLRNNGATGRSEMGFLNTSGAAKGGVGYGNPSAGSMLADKVYLYSETNVPVSLIQNSVERIELTTSGEVKINPLAGTGTGVVTADDNGVLSIERPPSSGTYVLKSIDGVIQWVAE